MSAVALTTTEPSAPAERVWSHHQNAVFDAVSAGDENVQISAVAGSGKTTTIVEASRRAGAPRDTLFCAFNRHIAGELQNRLPSEVTCSTIHGIGYRALREGLGRLRDPDTAKYRDELDVAASGVTSAIYGTGAKAEQRKLVRETLGDLLRFCRVTLTDPKDRAAFLAMTVRYGVDAVEDANARSYSSAVAALLEWGTREAIGSQHIDYDDMLWLPHRLDLQPTTFRRVMADEAQDFSRAQLELVLRSLAPGGHLIAVGDARQAIYMFSGADARAFDEIQHRTSAVRLPLSICYRCPRTVVEVAQRYVPEIEPAPAAADGKVEGLRHDRLLDQLRVGDLVLSRTNARAIKTCLALLARRVPARMRGRDIGKKVVSVIDQVGGAGGRDFDAFEKALDAWTLKKLAKLQSTRGAEAQIEALVDLSEAVRVCFHAFDSHTFDEFRSDVDDLFADTGNVVWISTIHRAKGLENDRVFILDFDRLPLRWKNQSDEQAQQESNAVYIAVTRAMRELYLVASEPRRASEEC